MEQGDRVHKLSVRMSDQELESVQKRMESVGIISMSAYLRKMALDGYITILNIPELKEMISLLRYSSNNLNQIARKANTIGTVYEEDLREIRSRQEDIWNAANLILRKLGKID